MGDWEHRDELAKMRIESYLILPENKLQSYFYHIGNTTTKLIIFICAVVPITDKYINREYLGYNSKGYEIKNKKLIGENCKNSSNLVVPSLNEILQTFKNKI
jgi:hypothetical protein